MENVNPGTIQADWRTEPKQWIRENGQNLDSAAPALTLVIKEAAANPELLPQALELLCTFRESHQYGRGYGHDPRFLEFGPLAIPTNARGIGFLRTLRDEAAAFVRKPLAGLIAPGSTLERFYRAFDDQAQSRFLISSGNDTNSIGSAFKFRFRFRPKALIRTEGKAIPPGLLGTKLEGYEFEGSQALEWQSEAGACNDGVAEFLDRFGIDYERESTECDSCGCETGSDGDIDWIGDFELDSDMIEALESAGYLESIQEFVDSNAPELEDFDSLAELSEADIRKRLAIPKDAIRYDRERWQFIPDFEEIEGLEEAEFASLVRLLPLFQAIASEYASAGALPPFPGVLLSTNPSAAESTLEGFRWRWCPERIMLSQSLSHALSLRYHPLWEDGKRLRFFLPFMNSEEARSEGAAGECWPLEGTVDESTFYMFAPGSAAGPHAARLLGVFQGSAAI